MMLPKLLVIDDVFGRDLLGERNLERENLCAHFRWRDATSDRAARENRLTVLQPIADVVFHRGQAPLATRVNDCVTNDLSAVCAIVQAGWTDAIAGGVVPWAMVLLDLCFCTGRVTERSNLQTAGMPEGSPGDEDPRRYFGLKLLETIHRICPELPIVMFSSKPRDEVSLEFSKGGALGFIDRADPRAPGLLQDALRQHGLLPDDDVMGCSLPLLLALREARRAARHRENVLVRGERGTGKELFASYIHRMSARGFDPSCQDTSGVSGPVRTPRPFVAVNSAAFTSSLAGSELFGIEPRTATGVDGKIGLIEAADGGDLFLDEIGDMPAEVQGAVLRVLQERQVTRIGGRKARDVDVRFVSATNVDLEKDLRGFRTDLLDRLRTGGTVWLPPLRERCNDIPLLAERFVRDAIGRRKGARSKLIAPEAIEALKSYPWPGNIRELSTAVFDAVSRFPDVEYLLKQHLRLGEAREPSSGSRLEQGAPDTAQNRPSNSEASVPPIPTQAAVVTGANVRVPEIDDLLNLINGFEFSVDREQDWAGRWSEVQLACNRLMTKHLCVCLEATKRRTPDHPSGQLQIHPAVKLLTGDRTITASRAADLVKRLLSPLQNELSGVMQECYEAAVRLRPKSPTKSRRASKSDELRGDEPTRRGH
jgi:DNA-binding NtrC family response regulator